MYSCLIYIFLLMYMLMFMKGWVSVVSAGRSGSQLVLTQTLGGSTQSLGFMSAADNSRRRHHPLRPPRAERHVKRHLKLFWGVQTPELSGRWCRYTRSEWSSRYTRSYWGPKACSLALRPRRLKLSSVELKQHAKTPNSNSSLVCLESISLCRSVCLSVCLCLL